MITPRDLDCLLIPYVLFHINVGVTEVPFNRRNIAGFLDEVPTHAMAGVMKRVAPYPGQFANLIPNRVDHLLISSFREI